METSNKNGVGWYSVRNPASVYAGVFTGPAIDKLIMLIKGCGCTMLMIDAAVFK